MIVEWLVAVGAGIWEFIAGLVPDWDMPRELADPNGSLGALFSMGQGLEPFVNWPLVTALGAIPLAVWVIGITWSAFRTLISHIPFFGGNG